MSGNGKYAIICRRGFTFGYLCPTKDGFDWVTPDIEKAYTYGSSKEAEVRVEGLRNEAKSLPSFEREPLELSIVKIEKVCKAT